MRALIAIVLAAGTSLARAGDANDAPAPMARARAIAAAEAHLRAARAAAGDAARDELEACGQAYLGVFDDAPTAPDADELLYAAATCFAQAGSVATAVALGDQLLRDFPASRLAPHVLRQAALVYERIGWFDRALAASVRYATLYPGEAEAPDALWNAVLFAAALGDDAQVAELSARFERSYGRARPDDAGRMRGYLAARLAERGDVDGAIAAYAAALAAWRAPLAERVALLLAQAELQWQRSCPEATAPGLCVRGAGPLALVARRRGDAAAATAAFAQVAQVAQGAGPREAGLARARARVRLHQAEAAIEAVVAMGGVPPLAVDQRGQQTPDATRRLTSWLRGWQAALADAERAVTDTVALADGASAVAAVGALARLYEHAAAILVAAPVPRSLVGTPAAAIYRDHLDEVAAPLRERATQAAEACLSKAADLGIVGAAVDACGAVVGRARPTAWELAELMPAALPGEVAPAPEPVPAAPPGAP